MLSSAGISMIRFCLLSCAFGGFAVASVYGYYWQQAMNDINGISPSHVP